LIYAPSAFLTVTNTTFNTVFPERFYSISAFHGFDLDGVSFNGVTNPRMRIGDGISTYWIKLSTCTVGGSTLPIAAWEALTEKTVGGSLSGY
jgi:hypothetical protein